jgi:predicted ATPase/class 3 adenylate cyclase
MAEPQEAGAAVSPSADSPVDPTAVILTPDQRVRVFVSSTLEELAAERAAARRAIARLHLVPVWYESGARPHPPRAMYAAYLAQSQVFVGIYWQRYGWLAPGMEISGLEDECVGVSPTGPGEPGDADVPAGTVTFLLTDIEGSTRLWETVADAMEVALERHNRLVTNVIRAHGGLVVTSRGEGDSFFAMFASAVAAVEAAGACQLALNAEAWPEGATLRVRMGLHTGEARARGSGQIDHAPINRCARVKAAGHGGQVLVTKTTSDVVGGRLGGGFGLKKLGEFRLRDLAQSELIYQLTHVDLPVGFPPIRTLAERIGNLPVPVSSFIGRVREQEQTAAAISRARVVTLTGPGGVGKTRLALQVASQAAVGFADGAWLAELAPVRDPAGVDGAVAAVFSVTAPATQSAREALAEFLRGKQLLLVLDNCEHVLEEAATLAAVLARSCERLVILATSREALGIEGEHLVPVPPLTVPAADANLAAVTQAEAVRLFTERATAVKPGFAVTAQNAPAVAALVRRLDGVALAVELAAARIPAMTPAELARRLERSFAVLASARGSAEDRHHTLRATIDWSFQLLAMPEQKLLARMAVFAGGATLEAAESVCGGDGIEPDAVFELLAVLVARSLVVAEEQGIETRYRLLETIRQYGEERLDLAGETQPWRARHAGYYASLLSRVREHAHDPREVFWAVRLSADQDNLLAAWSWAIHLGDVDTAFEILAGFTASEVWTGYPLLLDGGAALQLPGAAEHPGYPLALAVSAVFATGRADLTGARELSRRATEANARLDVPDWRVEETVCAVSQNIAMITGAFGDAARLSEQCAALARAGGDLADASLHLGIAVAAHMLAANAPAALPPAREALALARQTGSPALIASALLAMGMAVASTDPDQARACLHESREVSNALGYHTALDLVAATAIAFLVGDQAAALELGSNAIRALQPGGDRVRMAFVFYMIAGVIGATRPEAAAIILGGVETYVAESPIFAQLVSLAVTEALGKERARELRARGADMDRDQAFASTLTQTAQALTELQTETRP